MTARDQGGADVRRYGHTMSGEDKMKTARPSMPRPVGPVYAKPNRLVAAVGPATPSRTIRVEPLTRRPGGLRMPTGD
jgi:hypothetical protein